MADTRRKEPKAGPPRVSITRLTLTDFRNYATLSLDLGSGPVVLTGENGAGKTNLLEAISFLTPGRGLRRAVLADVARHGSSGGFAIHATIDGQFGTAEIGTGNASESGESGRRVRINGANAKTVDALLEWLRIIWITPAMDGLFTGPAGDRRRFLDRLVLAIDPGHARRALDYDKAMRGRNRLLADNLPDNAWFDSIEANMAETGTAIAAARLELLRLLAGTIGSTGDDDGPFPAAAMTLAGTLEAIVAEQAAGDVEEEFKRMLRDGRARDRVAGRTLEGPHRSDLLIRHAPKDMPAALCSTGEQKALLVGMILSHARLTGELAGMAPVLLLDEIAAHLDVHRRAALFELVEELGAQAVMTGTDRSLFAPIGGRGQFFIVDAGTVVPSEAD